MVRKIHDMSTDSWMRRVHSTGRSDIGRHVEPRAVASDLSVESQEGWDPRDVWLRRIEEPRRRRAQKARD
jgi:hypothetical protein